MKISSSSWKRQLREKLKPPVPRHNSRIAVVGVGAELNGDDCVGILATRRLRKIIGERADLLVLEGGSLPENLTSPLRKFDPGLILLVDAADMEADAGTIALLQPTRITGAAFSTHSLPLNVLAGYLEKEIGCEVILIGIQPLTINFGSGISAPCRRAAMSLAREFYKLLAID